MITAVYVHTIVDSTQQNLIQRAVQGSEVISNAQLSIPHTLYAMGERKISVYGKAIKSISRKQYPFDWMHSMADRLALMVSMAKDSDRILMVFGKTAAIPDLFVLMARAYSSTIRIYRGTTLYEPKDLSEAERQYREYL